MWLLSPEHGRTLKLAGLLCAGALPGLAAAQDAYFIPDVKIGVEHHDNLQFTVNPGQDQNVEGYIATVGGIAGWRSPRGSTELRPRFVLQEFPDRNDMDRTSQYLDLRSGYDFLRDEFDLIASYRREDEYRAEVATAEFDEFDPNDPTTDESGQVLLLSDTRTRVQIRPEFLHRFNERLGAGVRALYQTLDYSTNLANFERTDYTYGEAEAYLLWALNQRTDLSTGVYSALYRADDNLGDADSQGLAFELEHRWTPTWSGTVTANFEKTEEDRVGTPGTEDSSDWGLTAGMVRQGQISQLRVSAGRTFSPTSAISRAEVDQIRAQYTRNLTQRWQLWGAARLYSRRGVGDSGGDDREYQSGQVGLRWNVTQTWYATGTFSTTRQKYENQPDSRTDNVVLLEVGYRGLSPQR